VATKLETTLAATRPDVQPERFFAARGNGDETASLEPSDARSKSTPTGLPG